MRGVLSLSTTDESDELASRGFSSSVATPTSLATDASGEISTLVLVLESLGMAETEVGSVVGMETGAGSVETFPSSISTCTQLETGLE